MRGSAYRSVDGRQSRIALANRGNITARALFFPFVHQEGQQSIPMQSFLIETLSPELESPSSSSTSLDNTQPALARSSSSASNPFRNPPPLPRRDTSGSTSTAPRLPPRSSSQASQSIPDVSEWKAAALNALAFSDSVPEDKENGSVDPPALPDNLGMHTCVVCDIPTVACCPLCCQASYCSREHMEKVRA